MEILAPTMGGYFDPFYYSGPPLQTAEGLLRAHNERILRERQAETWGTVATYGLINLARVPQDTVERRAYEAVSAAVSGALPDPFRPSTDDGIMRTMQAGATANTLPQNNLVPLLLAGLLAVVLLRG